MSVDTYLSGKDLTRYRRVQHEEVTLLISPMLYDQARTLRLDVNDFLVWHSLRAAAEPLDDHFHSPGCRH